LAIVFYLKVMISIIILVLQNGFLNFVVRLKVDV
jgi:hypothetical protein